MAWGAIGHRVVREITDKYVNAMAELKSIKYGNRIHLIVSNWATRSDTSFRYLNTW